MVGIISRASGPGSEDARLRKALGENRATITKIADHITQGGYSASKAPKPERKPDGLVIHVLGGPPAESAVHPKIRISLNGRVVAYDEGTGRQIHHIGDLRRRDGRDVFVLATATNGYFRPVDDAVSDVLLDIDGRVLSEGCTEDQLAAEISRKLGLD